MISTKQYTDTYNTYRKILREYSERMFLSSECRKTLIKESSNGDLLELLRVATECIYNLTGDECFRTEVLANLERRRNDTTQ